MKGIAGTGSLAIPAAFSAVCFDVSGLIYRLALLPVFSSSFLFVE